MADVIRWMPRSTTTSQPASLPFWRASSKISLRLVPAGAMTSMMPIEMYG
jgi:hypothetical protein